MTKIAPTSAPCEKRRRREVADEGFGARTSQRDKTLPRDTQLPNCRKIVYRRRAQLYRRDIERRDCRDPSLLWCNLLLRASQDSSSGEAEMYSRDSALPNRRSHFLSWRNGRDGWRNASFHWRKWFSPRASFWKRRPPGESRQVPETSRVAQLTSSETGRALPGRPGMVELSQSWT